MKNIMKLPRISNILILSFLVFITGCRKGPVINNPKDKILCRDGHCSILVVDARSSKCELLIKSPSGECIIAPTWINEKEFIYYINPLRSTSNTIHPLILADVKSGYQNMIYKEKTFINDYYPLSNEEIIIKDGVATPWTLLLNIQTGETTKFFEVYPELRRMGAFTVLPGKDSVTIHGLDTIKYKDLPRYPTGYIHTLSDSLDDIYLYDIGEDKLVQLTNIRWSDIHPVWSPDGKYIAFSSNKNGNYDIYVMELKTREINQLTSNPADDQFPEYSPDGSMIAYISNQSGDKQLWIMKYNGDSLMQLTKMESSVRGPLSWNPMK